MELTQLYYPNNGPMRVAGFMSGSGSNLVKIIEHQKTLDDQVYQIVVLFSDCDDSKAGDIGAKYHIPVVVNDIRKFFKNIGKKRRDLSHRHLFDRQTLKLLAPYEAGVAAYGGYMSAASYSLVHAFLGVNVHPADLSIEKEGKRVYTGDNAVGDAIKAGEKYIRSSTHIITEGIDAGPILMISNAVEVIGQDTKENQNRLKEQGDWNIFPRTLEYIAKGRFSEDEKGFLYFDKRPIPKGLRMEELT